MSHNLIIKSILLIWEGLKLFFILPWCFVNKKAFAHFWNKYYMEDIPENIFNLCVQWLLYKGEKYNLTYQKINILIFCIIWPLLTIVSLLLNIILLIILCPTWTA